MAELPELMILQRQMDEALKGRRVSSIELLQPKCANVAPDALSEALVGRTIAGVRRLGKWLLMDIHPDRHVLLNLGMGAELTHFKPGVPRPAKCHLRVALDDESGFTCRFWWFGYVRLVMSSEPQTFREIASLGPSPLDIGAAEFIEIARRTPKSPAKALILDQGKVSGIGNAYAHDILWTAGIHPLRRVASLTDADLAGYLDAIQSIVLRAAEVGTIEPDFYGHGHGAGHWETLMLVGYKEGRPCSRCGTLIVKIKTGSTATYLCPTCQPLVG